MIRHANGKLRSGSLTSALAATGARVEHSSKVGIEIALLEENERRLNHAIATPFLVPSLYETIDSLGIGPVGNPL
jgi:hypothetical protein